MLSCRNRKTRRKAGMGRRGGSNLVRPRSGLCVWRSFSSSSLWRRLLLCPPVSSFFASVAVTGLPREVTLSLSLSLSQHAAIHTSLHVFICRSSFSAASVCIYICMQAHDSSARLWPHQPLLIRLPTRVQTFSSSGSALGSLHALKLLPDVSSNFDM